jgi:diphthamide synthase (EF-2-diphthine--ammonia ligase)
MNSAESPQEKVWLTWSSGKDSAWALHTLRRGEDRDGHADHTAPGVEVVGLLTTVTGAYERVSMHGVREELLLKQAEAAGLPLRRVVIPPGCSNALYEELMERAMADARSEGVKAVVFGDLFLADVRAYRERQLARAGMRAIFPLWGRDTATLAREMIRGGLGARLTCLDPRVMPRELAGHLFGRGRRDSGEGWLRVHGRGARGWQLPPYTNMSSSPGRRLNRASVRPGCSPSRSSMAGGVERMTTSLPW